MEKNEDKKTGSGKSGQQEGSKSKTPADKEPKTTPQQKQEKGRE